MSKLSSLPILIPEEVRVEKIGHKLVAHGPKGKMDMEVNHAISVEIGEGRLVLKRKDVSKKGQSLHGLTRALIANMILGVSKGWSKTLELLGVGFRVSLEDDSLILNIGFSHPVKFDTPEGVQLEIRDNNKIIIQGVDKYLVGQVAANIRKIKPPDVYKGKGIRIMGEYIRKKVGKAGKVGVGVS